jgi:hypothetical protein
MIGFGSATRVYLAAGATDMRKGFDGLYGMARDRLGIDPLSGHLFVFCNGRRNRLKVLYWDGSGLWICNNTHATHCADWKFCKNSLSIPSTIREGVRGPWRCWWRARSRLCPTPESDDSRYSCMDV